MENSLLIFGAGVAGLTAGCYARMNGYPTTIYEMAEIPGGLCTSWNRKGYRFDASVAGLAGSAPGSPLYRLWEEIGVIKYCPLHFGEDFGSIRLLDGRTITIYTNIDRLEAHLLENFPKEQRVIKKFTRALRSSLSIDIPFSNKHGWAALKQQWSNLLDTASNLSFFIKYGGMSIRQFTNDISDPALATVFQNIVHFGGPDVPLLTLLLPLAYAHKKTAGIPVHGWLDFARSIEKRFLELGGEIYYQSKVEKLYFEASKTRGVILTDGSLHTADRIISAVDGRFTRLLLPIHLQGNLDRDFASEEISDQPVQVNLGVSLDFSHQTGSVTYILPQSVEVAGCTQHKLTVHRKDYDPDAAPQGKTGFTIFLESDYFWWVAIQKDRARYKKEKLRCAEMVLDVLEEHYPGFRAQVEVIDVSTPLTRERYTGNWMGAMQAKKPDSNLLKAFMTGGSKYSIGGLSHFYHTGQWAEAWGGITTAAQSGRNVIKQICREDKIDFTSTLP
jgi:phytoene dehydrogenase-like protein